MISKPPNQSRNDEFALSTESETPREVVSKEPGHALTPTPREKAVEVCSSEGTSTSPPLVGQDTERDNWLDRSSRHLRAGARTTWGDSLVAHQTCDREWIITSPNVSFIPQPVYGRITVFIDDPRYRWLVAIARKPEKLGSDWRTPIRTPLQNADTVAVSNSRYFIVSASRRKNIQTLVDQMSLRVESFAQQCGVQRELQSLVESMKNAFDRLDYPSTQRDLIHVRLSPQSKFNGDLSRDRPHPRVDLMGAFTADPGVVQKLFEAGVPVRFMRQERNFPDGDMILRIVEPDNPTFRVDRGPFPHIPIYEGWAGDRHIGAIAERAHSYLDLGILAMQILRGAGCKSAVQLVTLLESTVQLVTLLESTVQLVTLLESTVQLEPRSSLGLVARLTSECGKRFAQTSSDVPKEHPKACLKVKLTRTPKFVARSTFAECEHDWLPPSIPEWQHALAVVDRSRPAPERPWGYWLPDPVTIANTSAGRSERHLKNWMRARAAWFQILNHDRIESRTLRPFKNQDWRDLLNPSSKDETERGTKTADRKRAIVQYIERASGADNLWSTEIELDWYGEPWSLTSLQQISEILWELYEVTFRYELLELDRHLVTYGDASIDVQGCMEVTRHRLIQDVFLDQPFILTLLPKSLDGLAGLRITDRAQSLEALRKIVSRWPSVPETIRSSPPLTGIADLERLARMESAICKHYVQTFWAVASRAAMLPRRFPLVK
ncbi:hypothetical protein NM688_g2992 [Phlebia brevispora]|uniref:Uncharacterized protein n=1 Tax=Phlebia brevispora TaxID=194682 RepID=A0ACC1T776_9APHY|nr:hypothetical protein NM688_g2992 [Phlebia brevispora]